MSEKVKYIKPNPNCCEGLHKQMHEDFWGVDIDADCTKSATEACLDNKNVTEKLIAIFKKES